MYEIFYVIIMVTIKQRPRVNSKDKKNGETTFLYHHGKLSINKVVRMEKKWK